MAAVEGRTGNPGKRNPKKKNATSFKVKPGKEPRSQKPLAFRPTLTLEAEIEAAVEALGITKTQWLEQAAIAYLKQNPPEPTGGEGETKTETTAE
ncbi:hypothetical protein AMR41_10800 [Hapalosiphon sp. MRB220]|nr:hypothetical protein AMR41_10800 [Hapalosiphon sp. MRB220]